jgi:enamine deaminase RidA (YjgF/YER057c/UK114 family)
MKATTMKSPATTPSFLNPPALHDPTPFGYSHTVRIPAGADWVLVAGQYGSRADGSMVSGDFAEQVQQAYHNLGQALAAHGLDWRHVVQLRSYVVAPDFPKLGILGQAVGARWGAAPPTQTLLGVAALAMPDMLFEVEAVAVAVPG